jgi:hypothetical protein
MTASSPATAEPDTADTEAAAEAAYFRQVLHDLIDIGADIARALRQQAQADAAPEAGSDIATGFDRVSRAIRRNMLLARRLGEAPEAAAPCRRVAARKRILREVEDTIQRTTAAEAAEPLHAELLERLDAHDLDEEIDQRPVAEIIADICRDLGIAHYPGTHPWKRRTPADIAELCARARRPPGTKAADRMPSGRRLAAAGPQLRSPARCRGP